MPYTFSRFFERSQKSKRRRPAARCGSWVRAGFKPRAELLEQRVMLSVSTLSFTGPTYWQNFDSLPNTGADQTRISKFSSSGPFDAISPASGSTSDTGDDPQGIGASGMAGWSIAEYASNTLKDFISSGVATTGAVYDFGTASGAANRALGLVLTSYNSPEIGLTLVNNTGVMLPQVKISFTDEQWTENTQNQELDFYYGTTPTALPLSSSTSGFTQDANLSWATTQTAGSPTFVDGSSADFQQGVSDVISGLNWNNGSTLVLMWRESNSGGAAAMAIDNFSFSADAAAPAVANSVLTVSPGQAATITSSQLSTAVSPGGIPSSQITYTVGSTAPAHGTLKNGSTTLTTGSSFTQDDILAGNITYTPDASGAASDSFTFTVSDGAQATAARTFTVLTDLAGNQPPVNIVPAGQSVIASAPLVFSSANGNAVAIADPNVGSAPVQVALSVSHGALTLGGATGLTITAGSNGSASLTFSGAIADINNDLNGLTYVPAAGYGGYDTFQIVTDDLGHSGAGVAQTATNTVAITVVAPLLNEIEANPPGTSDNRYEYVELRGVPGASLNNVYLVVFGGVSTNNPGTADLVVNLSPYSLGSNGLLVVAGVAGTGHWLGAGTTLVSDCFFTQSGGFNYGTLSFYLFYSTSPFSSGVDYDANDDGVLDNLPSGSQVLDDVALLDKHEDASGDIAYGSAVVTEFNNAGTPDAATRFAGNITPSSSTAWYGGELVDAGEVASQINYDVTRESANEPPGMYLTPGDVNVPSAQPPVLIASPGSLNYTEKQGPTAIEPGIIVTDADNSTLVSATVTIAANYVRGEDVLSFANTASITGSFDSSTGILWLTGTDTVANYQAALRAVCYNNTSNNPSTAGRTVSFSAADGTCGSSAANRSITVIAVPEITVLDRFTIIGNGQATPIGLGSTVVGAAGPGQTFTIRNDGGRTLTLTTPFASTTHFSVGQPGIASLPPGQTTTFTVTLNTGAVWSGSEQISIFSNSGDNGDGAETPFTFDVAGTVAAASTTTGSNASANPSLFGRPVTFTAVVSAVAPGSGTPTGPVTFEDGGTTLGEGTLSTTGGVTTATFSVSRFAVGMHSITALYPGDGNYQGSTSDPVVELVLAAKAGTVTKVAASPASPAFGQTVTLTATVRINILSINVAPTGSVTFRDGKALLGTVLLTGANGVATATLPVAKLAVGRHSITATYAGNPALTSSSGPLTLTVAKAGTGTSVAASPGQPVFGQKVTITATVVITPLSPPASFITAPTGTVTFKDGSKTLGKGTLSTTGGVTTATLTTARLAVGNHSLTATYSGNGSFKTSSGAAPPEAVA
jgi:hypothetical protein